MWRAVLAEENVARSADMMDTDLDRKYNDGSTGTLGNLLYSEKTTDTQRSVRDQTEADGPKTVNLWLRASMSRCKILTKLGKVQYFR